MSSAKIKEKGSYGFQLKTKNPFIICMHHRDLFPKGNADMAPYEYLPSWETGNDFNHHAPWRMYHGDKIPGFPVHPHRGFETITIVTEGFADHADSLGAGGRYGEGDVQWMTAGKGIQHTEMFPLLNQDKDNPLELFQVWLNLPKESKFVKPHYKMLWKEKIPVIMENQANGGISRLTLIAGEYQGQKAPAPTPDSWAANSEHNVWIWLISVDKNGRFVIPKSTSTVNRVIYHYDGDVINVEGEALAKNEYLDLAGDEDIEIIGNDGESKILLLQGEPIDEPIFAHGPFVMNTKEEIIQAFSDYRETQFGGWPWDKDDPVYDRDIGRFANHGDGKIERPEDV